MERMDIDVEKLRKRKTTRDFQDYPTPFKEKNLIKLFLRKMRVLNYIIDM